MDPLQGALVSHYRVIEPIGAGGMGVVYLAEDVRLHRKVALKFISPESAEDGVAQKRLLHEAQAASALDHPNIATVHEVGDFQDQLFIAMAYYKGETLRQRLARGPVPVAEVVAIAGAIADGLAAAHAADVTHRDLKPANVFLTSSGQVKILDFGLAKVDVPDANTTTGLTTQGTTVGTIAYMSPEQARNHNVDRRADIWAFGVVLYEMLTGRVPFLGDSVTAVLLALATEEPAPVRSLRPDAPPKLSRLVEGALVKDPEMRTLTAAQIADALRRQSASAAESPSALTRFFRRPALAVPALVALAAALAVVGVMARHAWAVRRAETVTLAEMTRLVDDAHYVRAYDLAVENTPLLEGHGALEALWPRMSRTVSIDSDPPGARVSYAPYGTDEEWKPIGTTPLRDIRIPIGALRLRAETAGFETAEDVVAFGNPSFQLIPTGDVQPGMVRALPVSVNFSIFVFGLETPRARFNGFWIDRFEVSNRQFKEFVDAGGYRRPEFWREPILENGVALPFEQAMALFKDATGRSGPSTWSQGTYSAGQGDMPVTGVSWYEAAAYAAFSGKSLPTAYHWYWVASQGLTTDVIPFGTFNAQAPVAVNAVRALHRFGARGLAGNVKEWCVNEAPGDRRYILGGGYDEPSYLFRDTDARSPFARTSNIGFRTVKYDDGDTTVAPLAGMLLPPSRSYDTEKPVGDEVYQAYRRLYSYDRTDLAARIETVDEAYPDWRVEIVSFAAGYGPERMMAYLLLPNRGRPPFQTIVFMPGSGAWDTRVRPSFANPQYGFLLRSGRAVIVPVYKGAWERANSEYHGGDQLKSTSLWRDYVIFFAKDISRSLDYAATRPDLDVSRVGFLGYSRGAAFSPVMLTAEPRIKVASVWLPGLYLEKIHSEVDAINFAPRVAVPVLQLNGRFDYNFPPEASSDPFFRVLGTASEHKRRVVYETGHNLPANEAIRETLDWFDKYLGQTQ